MDMIALIFILVNVYILVGGIMHLLGLPSWIDFFKKGK